MRFLRCKSSRDKSGRVNDRNPGPTLHGVTGGHGGKGGRIGGAGGFGEAMNIAVEEVYRFRRIFGGTGGHGGEGASQGGDGGIGQGPSFGSKLVPAQRAGDIPTLSVAEFCREYRLSDRIRTLLDEQGFETAAALLEVSDVSLLEDGFKKGQIAEIKRALKELLFRQGVLPC
ncbi:hypothetical protein DFH07DRAFT_834799 [Mycena maculata]|uniref:SAM domain-containing protein n=1 Tax=Mycena maculata TaxID=230809 RepID=A0AAD7ILV9_9AGAR|nr:hypothetical protein DFH07DRAFT_834799 [Mycena maculata]